MPKRSRSPSSLWLIVIVMVIAVAALVLARQAPQRAARSDGDVAARAVLSHGPVVASVETPALPHPSGDVADDPAIWVDPERPDRSVVIGTDKAAVGGGIAVYDLTGRQLQFRADGQLNNVDLRTEVLVGGRPTVVVVASDRTSRALAFYRLDPSTRTLAPLGSRGAATGFEPYGVCMYRSAASGKHYVFVTSRHGATAHQYELRGDARLLEVRKVRSLDTGGLAEGCVGDDEHGYVYVAEEGRGVWRYGAEPDDPVTRTAVGQVGDGRLVADVEGLALARRADGGGHLIVSSQGDSTYALFDRRTGAPVTSFSVGGCGSVDAVSGTDGLDVTTADLGDDFPDGLLVVHDESNAGGRTSNFKFVDLAPVSAAATGARTSANACSADR